MSETAILYDRKSVSPELTPEEAQAVHDALEFVIRDQISRRRLFPEVKNGYTDKIALLTELQKKFKTRDRTMKSWAVWDDDDPNDMFYVHAYSVFDAAFAALREVGWSIGSSSGNGDEIDEDENNKGVLST